MRLVVFTMHYPYGTGEPFLENELRVAEKTFDEIVIVSYARQKEVLTRYIPHNAKVVSLRRKTRGIAEHLYQFCALFRLRVWKELAHGCRERGISNCFTVLKSILLDERYFFYLGCTKRLWLADATQSMKTVYYTYWLGSTVQYVNRRCGTQYRAFVSRAHGGDCFFDRGYVPWRADALRTLDAIYSISEMGRQDILEHYRDKIPALDRKLYVTRLGVVLPATIGPVPEATDPAVLVTCSNVVQLKRLDLMIEALASWNGRPLHWIHFGDGPLLEHVEKLALNRLGENPAITWDFRGRVTNTAVLQFYQNTAVTLFINCSDAEGIPVSVMEAMAYGIPALVRNVGGNAELVNNSCGVLLPHTIEAKDLAEAIHCFISKDYNVILLCREKARMRIESEYWAEKNYRAFWEHVERQEHDCN